MSIAPESRSALVVARAYLARPTVFTNVATGRMEEGSREKWLNHLMQHGWIKVDHNEGHAPVWTLSRPEGGRTYELDQYAAHFVVTLLDRFGPNFDTPLPQ